MLGFGAAAWKTAPRDLFIGWSPECRQRNLPLVDNNARFLILPWIRIPNLASHILARCEKQLLQDWPQRYALRPVLLESFCEIPPIRRHLLPCCQLDSCRSHHGAWEMFSQFQTDTAGQGHLALSIESGFQTTTDTLICLLRGVQGICAVFPGCV